VGEYRHSRRREVVPPDCPIYNVKYVSIYESTPEVVYVGYTPAYTGSYVYGGCVVYGTGYYYQPWYGHYYYPRPVTYGFAVHYSPYGGWGMSFGMSYGWFSMSVHSGGGYWGAGGYHAGYHHGYNNGYRHGYGADTLPDHRAIASRTTTMYIRTVRTAYDRRRDGRRNSRRAERQRRRATGAAAGGRTRQYGCKAVAAAQQRVRR
jgi:hypothetical protein